MKNVLLTLIICCIIFSCKKHTADNALALNWPCDIILDSATISNGLPGTWNWTKYVGGDGKLLPANKNIKLTFTSNATFTVEENSTVITSGTWHLQKSVSNQWELNISSPSEYLNGWVGVCENQIAFFDSYQDGPDNYFEKVK